MIDILSVTQLLNFRAQNDVFHGPEIPDIHALSMMYQLRSYEFQLFHQFLERLKIFHIEQKIKCSFPEALNFS